MGEGSYVHALRWRPLTPIYDSIVAVTLREETFKRLLVERAGLASGQRVLDLGCGTGTLLGMAGSACPRASLVGLDGDLDILAIALRKRGASETPFALECGSATALPFADGSFDRVLSTLFFHHLTSADKIRAAREVHRVLRPGGELLVADWGRASGVVMRMLFLSIQVLDGFANTADHVSGRLPQKFSEAGFEDVREIDRLATLFGSLSLYRARRRP